MTLLREEEAVTGDALMAKIITMVCLFAISMAVGCIPLLLSLKFDWFSSNDGDMRRKNKVVMGMLAFGGGVLFSTTFMHLLPEVDENIELLQEGTNSKDVVEVQTHKGHSHLVTYEEEDSVLAALRGLLIVLALSIHELFEGLAVGLEASVANVWYMFGAVSAHKYIISFCIGVELLASNTKRWLSIVYIFTFSFMSALGIAIGILLVGGAGAADAGIYSVVLQGLACGTLIYVVFFEIWKGNSGLLYFTCALLGFVVMVIIQYAVENYLLEL